MTTLKDSIESFHIKTFERKKTEREKHRKQVEFGFSVCLCCFSIVLIITNFDILKYIKKIFKISI